MKDSSDNTPIAGVNIVIHSLKGTGTNAKGEFFLKIFLPGVRTPFFVRGYERCHQKVKIEANKELKLDVYMQVDMKSIDQVVVAAKGERKEIHDVKRQGTPVAVIDGKQLAGRGTTITEVLNHQTGVKLRQTGGVGNQTKVNIRGLEGNRVQIYMDGYALNTPDGSFSINDIPLQFIDRIEIYKGIVPPEFGGDGLGSAINVV
ncbi:MAG: TonB-dependent receptor plug domain-containing protein, partial [Butyricimonas paravirosa]